MSMKQTLLEYADPHGFWGSRIGDVLMKVYYLVKEAAPKTVVELGRGDGLFLVALLAACEESGATLHSIDVVSSPHTKHLHAIDAKIECNMFIGNDLMMSWDTPIDVLFINTLHEDPVGLASNVDAIAILTRLRLNKWLPYVTGMTIIHGADWHDSIKQEIETKSDVLTLTHHKVGHGISILK